MLKKLGYISFFLGIEGLIFVIYILMAENGSHRIEPLLILIGITVVSIAQMSFVVYTLRNVETKTFYKLNTIDEYLSFGMEDNQGVMQFHLFWKIIGWIVIVLSIIVALVNGAFISDYVFNQWKRYDIYFLFSFFVLITSIASFIYTIRVVNRKWIGKGKENEEL